MGHIRLLESVQWCGAGGGSDRDAAEVW